MRLDADVLLGDRHRAHVLQPRRARADEDDRALERRRGRTVIEHIGRRDVAEAAERPAEGNQHGALVIDRNASLAEADVGEALRPIGVECEAHRGRALGEAREAEGQRFVEVAVVVAEQRHPAHHAVLVGERRVEEAAGGGGLLKQLQVAGIALRAQPAVAVDARLVEGDRWRQQAGGRGLGRAGRLLEHVAEHDVARDQRLREQAVALVFAADLLQLHQALGVARERAGGDGLDQLDLGAAFGLAEQHVEAECADAVVVEQRVVERGDLAPRPGPLALGREARLVDVHDHDARVDDARHHPADAHVVEVVLDALHELERQDAGGVQHEEEQRNRGEQDALQRLPQRPPHRGEAALDRHRWRRWYRAPPRSCWKCGAPVASQKADTRTLSPRRLRSICRARPVY